MGSDTHLIEGWGRIKRLRNAKVFLPQIAQMLADVIRKLSKEKFAEICAICGRKILPVSNQLRLRLLIHRHRGFPAAILG